MEKKRIIHIILIAISAIMAINLDYVGNTRLFEWFKPLTTILIILFPLLYQNKENPTYNCFIFAALIFCLVGDICLLWESTFVAGLASFLIGHLIYAFAFRSFFGFRKKAFPLLLLLGYAISYFLYLQGSLGEFFVPVLAYMSVITFMGWVALDALYAAKNKMNISIATGAILFIFSDSVIAFDKFKMPFVEANIIILSTYWAAIFLFVYSTTLKK